MAINDGIASLRTPISSIEVTPAGWLFIAWFALSRYGRNLADMRDRIFAQGEDDAADSDDTSSDE